jgi:hypothetical protein
MKRNLAVFFCLIIGLSAAGQAGDPIVVHEWSTFTSFHNEAGEALRRINTDDEPVPAFVHQLWPRNLIPATDFSADYPHHLKQGASTADPRVTKRLETPVLYFHLPAGEQKLVVDVTVGFRRGFLTEFFPKADATIDGQSAARV